MKSNLRNNRFQSPEHQILVATGNQALTTGALSTSGNSVNIANGQLGIMPFNNGMTGTFMTAGTLSNATPAIQVLQGTANSANTANVNAFGIGAPAYEKSAPIFADEIVSVSTYRYVPGTFDIKLLNGFSAPTVGQEYSATVTIQSELRDIEFTHSKRNQHTVSVIAENKTDDKDFLLQKLAIQLNQESTYLGGNMPFVVLGIDYSGGNGTVIGGIDSNDSINFMTYGGITYSLSSSVNLVQSLVGAIAADANLSTATIEVISEANAGSDTIDALLVVGLDESRFLAYDDSMSTKVRAKLATTLTHTTNSQVSGAADDVHTGAQWNRTWAKEVAPGKFDLSTVGHDYEFTTSSLTSPVDTSLNYTATTIDYWTYNESSRNGRMANRLTILLPAAITGGTAGNDADNGYTIATTATTTVTQLNASFGVWLGDANDKYNKIQKYGLGTMAGPFV